MTPATAERVINIELAPHQWEVLTSRKRHIFDGCGVGAGKTQVGAWWTHKKMDQWGPNTTGLVCANTYPQLYDTTLVKLYDYFGELGIGIDPPVKPRSKGPVDLSVMFADGPRWLLCRSLDHWKAISGIEAHYLWCDEVWMTLEAAINTANDRVRAGRNSPRYGPDSHQTLYTTILDDPTTWMYKRFVTDFDPLTDLVTYAPTHQNAKNLPPGYIEDLKKRYDPQMYKRMVLAQWVFASGQSIYHAFRRESNVSEEAEFDAALPVIWAHDFNIGADKPMSSCLCQVKRGTSLGGQRREELHVFDELILDSSDTLDTVAEFRERAWCGPEDVTVCGDATGKAKDTRSRTSDYGILLDQGFVKQRVPRANPPIRTRHNQVNGMLCNAAGDVRILIHPRCTTLIRGLETVRLKDGAQYLELETREQHVTTALGYAVCELFPAQGQAVGNVRRPF